LFVKILGFEATKRPSVETARAQAGKRRTIEDPLVKTFDHLKRPPKKVIGMMPREKSHFEGK
jgi:hypothetical protein